MAKLATLIFLVFAACLSQSRARQTKFEKEILDTILAPDKYDRHMRPPTSEGPVEVEVNIYVRSISEINDFTMDYDSQLTFRQKWTDKRLAYNDRDGQVRYLSVTDFSRIWTPDTFFSNEKTGHFHNIATPNILIRIYPNGEILYSMRISLKLSCPMDLRNYPMDNQVCSIILASYGYTTEDVVYRWKADDPVQLSRSLSPLQFQLKKVTQEYNKPSKTNTGEYSSLKVNFLFHREFSYYLIQVYIPLTMMVLISWICVWLDHRSTTLRILIWLAVLLVMSLTVSHLNSRLPPVSYTKAIDVWTGMCLTFVFFLVIELVVVSKIALREEKVRKQAKADLDAEEILMKKPLMTIDDQESGRTGENKKLGYLRRWLKSYHSKAKRIDAVARVCFPIAFVIFNILYWSTYYRIA